MSIMRRFLKSMEPAISPRLPSSTAERWTWSTFPFVFIFTTYYLLIEAMSEDKEELFDQLYDLKKVGGIEVKIEEVQSEKEKEEKLRVLSSKFGNFL